MHDLGRCRDRFCNTHDTAKINHPVKAENYGLDKIAPKISSMSPRVQFNSGIIRFNTYLEIPTLAQTQIG